MVTKEWPSLRDVVRGEGKGKLLPLQSTLKTVLLKRLNPVRYLGGGGECEASSASLLRHNQYY